MDDPILVCSEDPSCGIKKKIIYSGVNDIPAFTNGMKVLFHYKTKYCTNDQKTLDDSRLDDYGPMELLIGKKFKFEVWETCLKSMREKEVASFTCHESLVSNYPMVAKNLRDIRSGKISRGEETHTCALSLHQEGLGYPDLDHLLKNPQSLEFIIELVKVQEPGQYKKDSWAMTESEKLSSIPKLKEKGNNLYLEKKYSDAAEVYAEAIGLLDQLLLREKPNDVKWLELDEKRMPLLLNYSQCKLLLKDYYSVIEHCSEVIQKHPDNVKAHFRRAKAHVGAWNPKDAKADFHQAQNLDNSLQSSVKKELAILEQLETERNEEDKNNFKKMFS